nr:alanine/glycine transport protein [Raoultella sp. NCTC 9187]
MIGVFIDTVVICTASAVIIMLARAHAEKRMPLTVFRPFSMR